MVTFNMLCSCVSRDIFNYHNEDKGWSLNEKNDQYKILQYINFSSLLIHNHVGKNFNVDLKQEIEDRYKAIYREFSRFGIRCSCIDVTCSAIEFLSKQESDYLILDNGFARFGYIKLDDNSLITNENRNFIDFLAVNKYISTPKQTLSFSDIDKYDIEKRVADFCKLILKIYDPSQIILIEVSPAKFYFKKNKLYNFNNVSQSYINRFRYCFELLKKNIKGCLSIKAPNILFGDANHVWGLGNLHFINEIYEIFYYKQIDYFVKNKKLPDNIINEINSEYRSSVATNYFDILYNSINNRIFMSEKYNYLITAHGTVLFLNIENLYIFNSAITNINHYNKLINILSFNGKYYLFVVVNNFLYYIKKIDIFGNVELCTEMQSFDIVVNKEGGGKSISICFENMFLSARSDTSCIFVDRNQAWEHFKIT